MAEGKKNDAGKRRYSLVPVRAFGLIVDVFTFGANKYSDFGWKKVPQGRKRYTDALIRHWEAWRGGEWADPETKLPHLAHVGCNALILLTLGLKGRSRNVR